MTEEYEKDPVCWHEVFVTDETKVKQNRDGIRDLEKWNRFLITPLEGIT